MLTTALLSIALLSAVPAQIAQGTKPPIPEDTKVETTASGLEYSILVPGRAGRAPKLGDVVKVHYTGWLTDGTVFDDSRARQQPAEFKLGEVVAGWNEGLALVTPGARIKLTVPYQLGYGEAGRAPQIPARATLIFDIELLECRYAPAWHAPRPEAQVTTASVLKNEILAAGAGAVVTPDTNCELDFAFWNQAGELLQWSGESARVRPIKARPADLSAPFMKEAAQLMEPGTRLRIEVPPALFPGQTETLVCELELLRTISALPLPAFSLSDPAKLTTTASGLQIEVLREGTGATPRIGQEVTVHYAGWLTDGTNFDSSYSRGEPSAFRLGQVIAGWNEGLALMKEGGLARLTIPGKLAYGARGSPPKIGPDATLVFVVELLKVSP